jgi:N-methylhydantoinase A
VLKVGPESAGSRPGPACYGRGGTRPTITDAFAALGLVGLSDIGYSAVTIDAGKARAVVGELAEKLGRSIEETAEAIIRIAVSGMYTDISALVSRFGVDPREFSCLAFGGAGPMLACPAARELGMQRDRRANHARVSCRARRPDRRLKSDFIKTLYADLAPAARRDDSGGESRYPQGESARLAAPGPGLLRAAQPGLFAEMRYRGQLVSSSTRCSMPAAIAAAIPKPWRPPPCPMHQPVYGHADPSAAVQVISLRLIITGKTAKPEFPRRALVNGAATPFRHVDAWIDGARPQHRGVPPCRPQAGRNLRGSGPWSPRTIALPWCRPA